MENNEKRIPMQLIITNANQIDSETATELMIANGEGWSISITNPEGDRLILEVPELVQEVIAAVLRDRALNGCACATMNKTRA